MNSLFTLRSANRIANLTCGRIEAVYRDIYDSTTNYHDFLASFDYCAEILCNNSPERADIVSLKQLLEEEGYQALGMADQDEEPDEIGKAETKPRTSEQQWQKALIMGVLFELSNIVRRFKFNAILLPQVRYHKDGYNDDFISSPQALMRLLERNADCNALVLQPRERPYINRVTIFDAFPYFGIALRQVEQWPAVLFWNHAIGAAAFVPVKDEDELDYVFILAQEDDAFFKLNAYAESKMPQNHYLMHLSDLHFGARKTQTQLDHLEEVVERQVASLDPRDTIGFVVTGDSVNSPTDASVSAVRKYVEFLDIIGQDEAMFVIGNHDINRFGLALRHKNQIWSHISGGYPKLKVIDDIHAIFMLFNSNTGGMLAQGEVGSAQMLAMREQLSEIEDLEKYMLIAVLHHHVAAASYYANVYGNEQWREEVGKYKGREKFKRLKDADAFLEFLREFNTRFILHGHKHIPIVIDMDDVYVIACGSTSGKNKDYRSYNMLKFSDRTLTCTQFVEQKPDAKVDRQDIMTLAIDY